VFSLIDNIPLLFIQIHAFTRDAGHSRNSVQGRADFMAD
jgi:hypothetical protein